MAVSTKHPSYVEMYPLWEKCEHVYEGTAEMREEGTKYLPMLTDETPDAYRARLNRTVLYNAFYRTISGFVGMMFRIPAVLDAPEKTTSMMDDVTLTGIPLTVLAQEIAEQCLVVGRCGLYVNYPIADTSTMTQADAIAYNLRPSMSVINAEQIINWKCRRINNKYVLSMAVIKEEFLIPENEFKDKSVIRYRVLDLDENDTYRVRIMSEDDKGNDILVEGPFYPMMNGSTMNFIPLTIIGPENVDPEIDSPVLVDLCDINIAHYQAYSDYANGCHFSGLPTPVFIGMELPTDGKINVGMGRGIIIPNPAGDAKMLEVGTQGFVALSEQLNRLEFAMITLGSKLLENNKLQAESAQLAKIYRSGESSILQTMALSVSTGITIALKTFAAWAGDNPDEVRFSINREFFSTPVDAQILKELVAAWQSGGISAEARFDFLKKAEFYEPHISFDTEEQRIKDGAPKPVTKPAAITTIAKNPDGSMTATRAA